MAACTTQLRLSPSERNGDRLPVSARHEGPGAARGWRHNATALGLWSLRSKDASRHAGWKLAATRDCAAPRAGASSQATCTRETGRAIRLRLSPSERTGRCTPGPARHEGQGLMRSQWRRAAASGIQAQQSSGEGLRTAYVDMEPSAYGHQGPPDTKRSLCSPPCLSRQEAPSRSGRMTIEDAAARTFNKREQTAGVGRSRLLPCPSRQGAPSSASTASRWHIHQPRIAPSSDVRLAASRHPTVAIGEGRPHTPAKWAARTGRLRLSPSERTTGCLPGSARHEGRSCGTVRSRRGKATSEPGRTSTADGMDIFSASIGTARASGGGARTRRNGALRAASARRAAAADRGSNAEGTARTAELQSAAAATRGAVKEGARAAAAQRRLQRRAIGSTARFAVGTTDGDGRPPPRLQRQGTPNGSGITANAGAQCTTHDPHGHLDGEERPCLLPCPPWQGAPSRQGATVNEDRKLLIGDPRGLAEGERGPCPLPGQGR
jgi:hypothetical protein